MPRYAKTMESAPCTICICRRLHIATNTPVKQAEKIVRPYFVELGAEVSDEAKNSNAIYNKEFHEQMIFP